MVYLFYHSKNLLKNFNGNLFSMNYMIMIRGLVFGSLTCVALYLMVYVCIQTCTYVSTFTWLFQFLQNLRILM